MMKPLIIFLLSGPGFLLAQRLERQVIASGGAALSATGIGLSWTAGEPVAGFLAGNVVSLGQGFQQGELSLNPTDVEQVLASLRVKVYPNPTAAILHLEADNLELEDTWQIAIFSGDGRRVNGSSPSWPAGERLFSLDVRGLPAGQYYLHLARKGRRGVVTMPFQKIW